MFKFEQLHKQYIQYTPSKLLDSYDRTESNNINSIIKALILMKTQHNTKEEHLFNQSINRILYTIKHSQLISTIDTSNQTTISSTRSHNYSYNRKIDRVKAYIEYFEKYRNLPSHFSVKQNTLYPAQRLISYNRNARITIK